MVFLEEHVLVSASHDRTVKVWDCTNATRPTEVLSLMSTEAVTTLCTISASAIVWGTMGGTLSIRDLRSPQGSSDTSVGPGSTPAAIKAIQPISEHRLVSGDTHGRVEVRDLRFLKSRPLVSLSAQSSVPVSTLSGQGSLNPVSAIIRTKTNGALSRSTPSVIPESVWDIAMGKTGTSSHETKKQKKIAPLPISKDIPYIPTVPANAHNSALLCLGELRSNVILSLANDKTLKLFCVLTGRELHAATLPDRALTATFSNSKLLIGSRDHFTLFDCTYKPHVVQAVLRNSTTHIGGIVSSCFVGDWAICTGGSDKHIFVHKLAN